jgi:LysR family tcuABC transcriptional regulator
LELHANTIKHCSAAPMTSIVGLKKEFNLELRQLRYFLRIVDLGSMGKAAIELDIATAALSQQITKVTTR